MDEELTGEDSQDEPDEVDPLDEVEGDMVPRSVAERYKKESHSLRVRLRRTEFAKEFGDEVVELVPETLTLKEQRTLAEKLQAKLSSASTHTDVDAERSAEAAPSVPSEQDRRAAVFAREGGGAPTSGVITDVQEAMAIAAANPEQYAALKRSGAISLEKLPGS